MRHRVRAARVARLATVGADLRPHLVPVCFALMEDQAADVVYTAVDDKPKRSRRLRRVANVAATGRACLLVDRYDEDWSALWWVRLDCRARVVDSDAEAGRAVAALVDKYDQYQRVRPAGPVIALEVYGWRGWSAR